MRRTTPTDQDYLDARVEDFDHYVELRRSALYDRPFWTRSRRVGVVVAIALGLLLGSAVKAAADRPAAHERAAAHCKPQHVGSCRKALVRAYAALEWQREERRKESELVLSKTRGAMPFSYAAKLAHLACISFTYVGNPRCRPHGEMLEVGRCESGLQVVDPNASSTADGWMQFLESTWASTPAGAFGWSRYDVLAMAVATEARVLRDGGSWREWGPSSSCSGLS